MAGSSKHGILYMEDGRAFCAIHIAQLKKIAGSRTLHLCNYHRSICPSLWVLQYFNSTCWETNGRKPSFRWELACCDSDVKYVVEVAWTSPVALRLGKAHWKSSAWERPEFRPHEAARMRNQLNDLAVWFHEKAMSTIDQIHISLLDKWHWLPRLWLPPTEMLQENE